MWFPSTQQIKNIKLETDPTWDQYSQGRKKHQLMLIIHEKRRYTKQNRGQVFLKEEE